MPVPRVLLAQAAAAQRDLDHSHPLGLMSLAAYLRRGGRGYVRIVDLQLSSRNPAPFLAALADFRPEIVGLSAMTVDFPEAARLARLAKEKLPETTVVIGGPHVTHKPAALAEEPALDFAIAGEGEVGFAAFLERWNDGRDFSAVPNLVHRVDDGLRQNDPAAYLAAMDELPFPAWDLIDVEAYYRFPPPGFIYRHRRYASLITSRGCPFGCAYCHNVHGRKYRCRSAENVAAEMEQLVAAYRIGEFVILDDLFNLLPERVTRLAELILEKKMDVALNLPTGLRADLMTEEGLRLLRRAGMYRCLFAVDTTSPRLQEMTGRRSDTAKILRMIELAHRLGILVHGTFIVGFPTETAAEARDTVRAMLGSKLHTAAIHRAIPFFGTGLYDLARRAGVELAAEEADFDFNKDASAVNASAMSNEFLARLRRWGYRRFYLSPWRMWHLWRRLPNKRQLLPLLFRLWVRKAFTG